MSSVPDAGSFVFDENLAPQLAQAFRLLDDESKVDHITTFYAAGTEDVAYLPDFGRTGAFLVTRDARQRKKPAELAAYRIHGVGAFILGGKNLDRWELVKQLVLSWPQITEAASKTRRPFAYRVRANGGKLEPLSL